MRLLGVCFIRPHVLILFLFFPVHGSQKVPQQRTMGLLLPLRFGLRSNPLPQQPEVLRVFNAAIVPCYRSQFSPLKSHKGCFGRHFPS